MAICRKIIFYILVVFISAPAYAQVSKGDAFFQNLDYHKAIACYLKAFKKKKNSSNPELLAKMGDAFRFVKDYSNASNYYKLALQNGSQSPDVFLHYGMILKSTGNYTEAETQFQKCLDLRKGDIMAMNGIRSCKEIKTWKTKLKEYDVTNLEKINTEKSEFSPLVWKNQLVFVAERENDLINFSHYDFNGQPFLNVYAAELKGNDTGKPKEFSKKLNTNYHDGPVCFSKDGNTIYYTRVKYTVDKKNKDFVNRAKVYTSAMDGNNLKKEMSMSFDSDDYSIAHPSISDDGQFLFFSSDKPGGIGGMDIYFCKKSGDTWETPVNLGPDINTTGNEEFPFIRSDGILFFSSDGLPGFGGMDIFSAYKISGRWILKRNEGLGLNDITDDFGIFFTNDKEGYFSSDRPGGKGADDIYTFKFAPKSQTLEGFVLNSMDTADVAKKQKLFLIDTDGNKSGETRTDGLGYFKFENLDPGKNYLVKMDENDPDFTAYNRYYYSDKNGNIMRVTKKDDKNGKFVFSGLPLKDNSMADLEADDDFTVAGNVLYGDKTTQALANTKLVLKDEKGHVVDETTTNAFGSFVFRNLPPGNNYMIEMQESDVNLPPDSRIVITNKDGKEIKVMRTDSKGKFKFALLAQEKKFMTEMSAEDKDLIMDLSGTALDPNKKIIAGTKVFLLDDKGNKIAETTTAKDGTFTFKNLAATKNYMLSMDVDDPTLGAFDKIYIADKKGKIVKELRRKNNFKYTILSADKKNLTEMYVDDPWLEVLELKNKTEKKDSITIVENVYYASGDWKFDEAAQNVLDKVIKIMKDNPNLVIELSSHTDSRADDNFNLNLSKKRAKTAVDYCITHGVNKNRITAVGHGETKLINNCGNGVECSDEQHAQNRRTEFKIHQKGK